MKSWRIEERNILDELNEEQRAVVEKTEGQILVLAGAGAGKCVTGDSLIFTSKGIIPIEDIPQYYRVDSNCECEAVVRTVDMDKLQTYHTYTSHFFDMGEDDTVKIQTSQGYELEGTYEHPVVVLNHHGNLEFKPMSALNPADIIAICKNIDLWGNNVMDREFAYLLSLLTSDGILSRPGGTMGFSKNDEHLSEVYCSLVEKFFGKSARAGISERDTGTSTDWYFHSTKAKEMLENTGMKMAIAGFKEVPRSIMEADRESVIMYLRGLFDTDGSFSRHSLEYCTKSHKLAKQVHMLLLNLGIMSKLKPREIKGYEGYYYYIYITGNFLRVFRNKVGFLHAHSKKKALDEYCDSVGTNNNINIVYNQSERLRRIRCRLRGKPYYDGHNCKIKTKTDTLPFRDYVIGRRNPTPLFVSRLLNALDFSDHDTEYLKFLSENFYFDKITMFTKSRGHVYDFTVPDTHCFISNGIVSHNTRSLTYKVAYLLNKGLAKPHNILAVTFTNKAAQEMKERITTLVEIEKAHWWIGTFHGICVRILVQHGKEIGIPSYFTIADEKDQQKEIKSILESHSESNLEIEQLQNLISWAKNNLVRPADIAVENPWGIDPVVGQMYNEYQERLQKMNTLDFDDLIMKTIDLLTLVPSIRERFQKQFRYVLSDESQDLNAAQMEFLRLMSGKYHNLTLIGDVDQNIYSWRGASLDIVMAFSKDPATTTMKLEQNYRCSKVIVEASNEVVKKNKNRLDKTLWTANDPGDMITYYHADTEYEEAAFVAGIIDHRCNIKREADYKDFAILYRTNSQSRILEDALSKLFIPYQIIGNVSFYERKEVKDTLAYLKLIVNPNDVLSFQRIANEPKRGVGPVALKAIVDFVSKNGITVSEALDRVDEIKKPDGKKALNTKCKEALRSMNQVLKEFMGKTKDIDPARFIKDFIVAIGYIPMLEEKDEEERILNVYELSNMASAWYDEQEKDSENCLEDFVRQLNLLTDTDTIADTENVVKMMTVHCAKGLEYENVFIVGMEENIFPHIMALKTKDRDVEEERRLCYVSMTRAKKRLYLINAEERYSFGKQIKNLPSRFIKEIPDHLIRKI